jgi:molybdenum cofactor cytidylyltransferase
MTFAVIPAAGKSSRMGCPKLTLPLGNQAVIEQVIASLRQAEVNSILVVVGPHVPELAPLASAAGAHVLLLPEETPDMRATVEKGLEWLENHFHPEPDDDWLLVPADHPTLDAGVVRQLVRVRRHQPDHSIFVPVFQGKRGHPALLRWKHVAGIRALAPTCGVNAYLRQQAAQTLEVPVQSAEVLADLDTPEDYERLKRKFQQ